MAPDLSSLSRAVLFVFAEKVNSTNTAQQSKSAAEIDFECVSLVQTFHDVSLWPMT